jgi:isocitrate lyase family protein
LWWETSEPDLAEAERFADAIHHEFPGKMLGYNCSPSFNWRTALSHEKIAGFQHEIAQMGYHFQFVTLAGFHSLNLGMFNLARNYRERGMAAYSELQQTEFAAEQEGYTATRHQREVGVEYFDRSRWRSRLGTPLRRRSLAARRRPNSAKPRSRGLGTRATTRASCTTMTGQFTTGRLTTWQRAGNSAAGSNR